MPKTELKIMNLLHKYVRLTFKLRKIFRRHVSSDCAPPGMTVSMQELARRARMSKAPRRIMFFGTDNFSVSSLSALHEELIRGTTIAELRVVTSKAKKGRSAVEVFCSTAGLPLQYWPVQAIHVTSSDVGVVVSFGHLIPADIIEAFPLGVLNVHGSLLPAYRGAAPIIWAIINGDTHTGVTVMRIHPYKFDVGEILCQHRVTIAPHTRSGVLHHILASEGARLLLQTVRDLPSCYERAHPQTDEDASSAPKVSERDAEVLWLRHSARQVYRRYLALDDHHPLWGRWRGRILQLREALPPPAEEDTPHGEKGRHAAGESGAQVMHADSELSNNCDLNESPVALTKLAESVNNTTAVGKGSRPKLNPGDIFYCKKEHVLWVGCADDVIAFKEVRLKGKKSMTPHEFKNGFLGKVQKSEWRFDV